MTRRITDVPIGAAAADAAAVGDDLTSAICYDTGRQPAHLRMYTPKTFRDVAR
jgi:hypothetical protein